MQMKKGIKNIICKKQTNAILLFFAVMAGLTILSRIADSFMIPQVAVSTAEEMELKYPVEIEGRVGTEGKRAVYCRENLRIGDVLVEKNDIVEKGDLLFSIDMEDLTSKIEQTEQEIRKCELQIADLENAYQKQVNLQNQSLSQAAEVSGDEPSKAAARQIEDAGVGVNKDNSAALQQMEKESLEDSLQQLNDLREENGKVYSGFEGCILECSISTGSITTLEPAIILEDFSQPFQFEGFIGEKDSPFVEEGTECTLEMMQGDVLLDGVKISEVAEGEDGMYRVSAKVDSDSVYQTGSAVLSFTESSRRYPKCIPLSALYSGKSGYYVIEIKEDETVLGAQLIAEYVPVTLIENNDEYAAVEGEISEYSKLVVRASKTIKEGDRVRIMEE